MLPVVPVSVFSLALVLDGEVLVGVVYIVFRCVGKYFGGEQVSLFLQNNIHHRQVSAYTGEVLNAACFNTNSFRDYFKNICLKIAKNKRYVNRMENRVSKFSGEDLKKVQSFKKRYLSD